jgi:hypothetical protein
VHRVERAPEAVADHRVDQLTVVHAVALARVGKQVGRAGHRLHAAGDDDLGVACLDHLIGEVHRVDAGEADLVHGHRGHRHRHASRHRSLARRHLTRAGLQHLAHEHVVDLVAGDARPGERRPDRVAAEIGGGQRRQRTGELSDRRASRRDDHRTGHIGPPQVRPRRKSYQRRRRWVTGE